MLSREEVAPLLELLLDRATVDEAWLTELRQQKTPRDAALRILESQHFVHHHQLELATAFGVRAEIQPYL